MLRPLFHLDIGPGRCFSGCCGGITDYQERAYSAHDWIDGQLVETLGEIISGEVVCICFATT
jgi:hypothetical protein